MLGIIFLISCNVWKTLGGCSEIVWPSRVWRPQLRKSGTPTESPLPPCFKKCLVTLFVTGVLACPPFSPTTYVAACTQATGHKENKDWKLEYWVLV